MIQSELTASGSVLDQYYGVFIAPSILSRIPYGLAVEFFVLPIALDSNGRIQALMAYPNDSETLQQLQIASDCSIRPIECPKEELLKLIAKHYGVNGEQANKKASGLQTSTLGTPQHQRLSVNPADSTINLVNDIVHEAIRLRASDIHFEPFEREMLVRFRVDGVLQEMVSVPLARMREVTSRLKIMARMDIAEKRRSQDGRIRIQEQGKDVDVRVSTLPTDFGEKTVLRLLDKASFDYNLESIGMPQSTKSLFPVTPMRWSSSSRNKGRSFILRDMIC